MSTKGRKVGIVTYIDRTCSQCGQQFSLRSGATRRTCSDDCLTAARRAPRAKRPFIQKSEYVAVECPCGAPTSVPPWKLKQQKVFYCSPEHRSKYAPKPKGRPHAVVSRIRKSDDGYPLVYLPPGERPSGWGHSHYPEHRQVMRKRLGRDLLPGENVHHINGDKTDNRPENLELWLTSQPKGQRVSELLAWAREIVSTYEPVEDVVSPH